jgi:hypothetical protein
MGAISEKFTLYASQFTEKCDMGELDFPMADVRPQEDFFKYLVWGEGNYQQFKYSWFAKAPSGNKTGKGLVNIISKLLFLNLLSR